MMHHRTTVTNVFDQVGRVTPDGRTGNRSCSHPHEMTLDLTPPAGELLRIRLTENALWLVFEARQGAEGQGTPRDDDMTSRGGATGSVRVFLMATDDTRYRLRRVRVPVALDTRTSKTVKNSFALNFLTVHVGPLQSPCGLVS